MPLPSILTGVNMKTIKLKNNSTRLHHIGGVAIIPGGEGEVPEVYKDSINKQELEIIESAPIAASKKPPAFSPAAPAPVVPTIQKPPAE